MAIREIGPSPYSRIRDVQHPPRTVDPETRHTEDHAMEAIVQWLAVVVVLAVLFVAIAAFDQSTAWLQR